jgi:hypothetical protein
MKTKLDNEKLKNRFLFIEKKDNNNNHHDDEESIKDEQVRKDIQILSARLYDLKERFMKIVDKINKDSTGFVDQTSDEGKRKKFI